MSTSNVFGVIVTGRLIQTNFIQAAETEFITELEHANTINHVVVFLTGVSPFPDHLGGSVYIRWQKMGSSGNEITGWRYLGFISNAKPSAIFRIGQLTKGQNMPNASTSLFAGLNSFANTNSATTSAQIGIMVEPLSTIESRTPEQRAAVSQQSTMTEFAQKMLSNFLNHVQSFAVRPSPSSNEEYVPLRTVQDWFNNFQRRLQMDPSFWKSLSS